MVNTAASKERTRILVVGGGYVGMYTALRLQKRLKSELKAKTVEVIVVDPRSYMTYQPFLPEAAAGSVEPRHVVVPLRRVLDKCEVLTGRVDSVDHSRKVARIHPVRGEAYDLSYEVIVLAPGSIARTLPIPGLAEQGIGFKQVEEAIALRNAMLEKLDIATTVTDHAARRALLTFVFVGGGYAGIEALGELEDMTSYATRYYPDLSKGDIRFVLVEASNRILPEVGPEMGAYAARQLQKRTGWAQNTVRTLLTRLIEKGALQADDNASGIRQFTPAVERDACVRVESDSFLQRVFHGAAKPLLIHFASNAKLTPEEVRELKRLFDQNLKK